MIILLSIIFKKIFSIVYCKFIFQWSDRAETFREHTGVIPFMDHKCKPRDGIPIYPENLYSKNINNLPFEEDRLRELYPDEDSTCAVWLFPYIQFQVCLLF